MLDNNFKEIHVKLDELKDHVINIDKTLIRQEASLAEHMLRSELNEKAIDIIKEELKPIKTYIIEAKTVLKILSVIGGVVSALFTVWMTVFHK